jgi:hypothetical protein
MNFAPQPMFSFAQPLKVGEPPAKLKGYKLGEFRKNQYMRSTSMETPQLPRPLLKRPSWDERQKPQEARFQLNDVVRENVELLRKYSDPKVQFESASSSLSMLQSAFKAKLASLFRNKKKYTIAEPSSSGKENVHCDSSQSLPMLFTKKKRRNSKKERKKKKSLMGDAGKLNALNLNPPQMIGGSFDNLLLLNRMNKPRTGTYDTYHGRPLMSHASRLKALYKYRKPSESDDTTLSFDYDSGEMSDTSSLARSSSDIEEDSSSFSDLTTKSSNRGFKIRSSTSVHSMPMIKIARKSPDTPQFPLTFKPMDVQRSASVQYSNIPLLPKPIPYNLTHQLSAPALYSPYAPSLSQQFKPNYFPTLSMPASNVSQNQMIKAFFTAGPASSNDFPLVSFLTHP